MNYIKPEEIVWREVAYLKEPLSASPEHAIWKYHIWMNEPLSGWDVFDYWEKERIASMEEHLTNSDVLFDIGTEQGWCNIVYGKIVGPENVVLIEPTQEFWPNIKALWEKNFGNVKPKATLPVLLSDKNTEDYDFRRHENGWPESASGDLIDRNKYQYIHENSENIPEMTIDSYVTRSGIIPSALTMDVEGAELLILRGAENTLRTHKPKCWISIHPDLGLRDYNIKKEETIKFMEDLGYIGEYLATDHEEHWYFHI